MPSVAFLGYGATQTRLVDHLCDQGADVSHHTGPIRDFGDVDLVVSFGYRHILKPEVLATARRPVLNLHISYLPYNRGAHPNFWSWIEGTPAGVSIHEIDAGIDTGAVVDQHRLLVAPEGLSFRETHAMLIEAVEALFVARCADILAGRYRARPQSGEGTFHRMADLPDWMDDWDMPITEAIARHHG